MSNKYPLFLLGIGCFFACKKEIDIKMPERPSKLVVNSVIFPYSSTWPPLCLELQGSLQVSDTAQKSIIRDAEILYYENNVLIDTLKYVDSLKQYLVSASASQYPQEGNEYSIRITRQGYKSVTASTSIPPAINVLKTEVLPVAFIDETGSAHSEVSISFTDPPDKTNFYEVAISDDTGKYFYFLSANNSFIAGESYYPSVLDFKSNKLTSLPFNDTRINGQNVVLKIYYVPPQLISGQRYISAHTLSIHLRSVTEEYYKFRTTFFQHLFSLQGNILYGNSEPVNVFSNIQEGYGIFAGYNNSIHSVSVPQTLVK